MEKNSQLRMAEIHPGKVGSFHTYELHKMDTCRKEVAETEWYNRVKTGKAPFIHLPHESKHYQLSAIVFQLGYTNLWGTF